MPVFWNKRKPGASPFKTDEFFLHAVGLNRAYIRVILDAPV